MSRLLRTYQHIARIEHPCDHCCRYIHPGEMYEGSVMTTHDNSIITYKIHINPYCEDPEEPDYEEGELEQKIKNAA